MIAASGAYILGKVQACNPYKISAYQKMYINILTISCLDIDECAIGSPCSVFAACKNMVGSFLCWCNWGYTGNGFTCAGWVFYVFIKDIVFI